MAKRNASTRKGKSTARKKKSPGLIAVVAGLFGSLLSIKPDPDKLRRGLAWSILFICLVSLIACVSYFFTGQADQSAVDLPLGDTPKVDNWLGFIGAKIAELLIASGFGVFGLLIPLYGFLLGFVLLENAYYSVAFRLLKYVLFIVLFGSLFVSFFLSLIGTSRPDLGGGFGFAVNDWLFSYIGKIGVGFLLLFIIILFLVFNFNAEFRATRLLEKLRMATGQARDSGPIRLPFGFRNPFVKNQKPASAKPANVSASGTVMEPDVVFGEEEKAVTGKSLELELGGNSTSKPTSKTPKTDAPDLELTIVENPDEPVIPAAESKKFEQIGEDNIGVVVGADGEKVEKIVPESDQELENAEEITNWELYDPTLELSDYQRPTLDLLEDHGSGRSREVDRRELEENKNKIVDTLQHYGISIMSIKATIGPTVTLYEIVPAPGVRISKIRNLEDDIALNLAALGIRIIAPIPGKGTVGIEVPNSNPEIVSLKGVLATEKFLSHKGELPVAIGRTISNEVFVADLNKMPHLLIAGATGQGKSVGLNTIIASLLYKKHPAEIKFVLIDPKKVEMSLYQALRMHFLAQLPDMGTEPIVNDVRDAVHVLKSLTMEMDNRYELLKRARVRNLKEYNKKFVNRRLNPRKGHRYLPYIILVIDELADMMMVAGKEVEMPIARLAQLARAIGIHLVVATQRPSVNVITGIIKANFPARMSFRVSSKVDSRTILDANGADQLVGRGDMLLSTGNDLVRIQSAFIDTPEIDNLVNFISSQRGYTEPYLLPEIPIDDEEPGLDDEPLDRDSKFDEAARTIVRHQIGSASLIQRKMKLGYNRAGRIIDQLEKAGIVGPHSGSKARDVLIQDEIELERYLSRQEE